MGFTTDTAEGSELAHAGGNMLSEPCTAHVTIVSVKDGLGPNGAPIDGFTIEIDVLAAKPVDSHVPPNELVGKKLNLTFWPPDPIKQKEKGLAMTKRLNTNFLLATGLLRPEQLGQSVNINPEDANGKQMIVRLERQQEQVDGKWVDGKYLRVAFADIFHVDDPEVASIPKNVAALKFIPPELRHKPEWFAYKAKGQAGAPPKQNATAPVAAGGVDVDV